MQSPEEKFKSILADNHERLYRICCYYFKNKEDRSDLYQVTTENIVESFKRADRIQKRKLVLLFTLLIVAGLIFLLVLSMASVFSGIGQIIIANVFVVIMILIAISLRSRYTEKDRIDYSLTTLELLKKTERRYRFWNSEWIFIVVLILICNITTSIIFSTIPVSEVWTPLGLTVLAQMVYFPLLGLAFLAEWISWKKVRKPLRARTLELIKELES